MRFEDLPERFSEVPRGSLLVSARVTGLPSGGPGRDYANSERELMLGAFAVESWEPWVDATELSSHGFLSRHVEVGEGGARLVAYGAGSRLFLGPGQDLVCTFEVPGDG